MYMRVGLISLIALITCSMQCGLRHAISKTGMCAEERLANLGYDL